MPKSKAMKIEDMFDDETLDAMDDAAGVDRLTKDGDFSLTTIWALMPVVGLNQV